MRARIQGWLFGTMILAIGCAHAPAPRAESPPPPPARPRIKLAVLPVDSDTYPQIAASLNNALNGVKVNGVDDYFLSKVTLEVVQLSIECVQPTSACYSSVGRSLSANKLLLGHITQVGRRRRDKSVRVTITLFDVDAGEAANVVDRIFKTPELASQGAQDLVAEATEPVKDVRPRRGEAVEQRRCDARTDGARRQTVSTTACPSCNKPLPAAVVNGPAQAVVRCESCQTLLLWSNGRVMRSAKSSTGTMMGMQAVTPPAAGKTLLPPPAQKAPPRAREAEAPLTELKPEADGAPPAPKSAAPQPAASKARPTMMGIGVNVPPTKVVRPSPEVRREVARKDPTPAPIKAPPPAAPKASPPAPSMASPAAPSKASPSGPSKASPAAPSKASPSGPSKASPAAPSKASPSGPVKLPPGPPPSKAPAAAPQAKPPQLESDKNEAPHVVAAVAQVPSMNSGDMVDPSAWFAGDVSEVVPPGQVPVIESGKPARGDSTGAPPLPPPPSLPPLEVEPFEIEAPGNENTPAIGTLMPEARSGPIAVHERGPAPPSAAPGPSRPSGDREPSQKIVTPEPPPKVAEREPSQKIVTREPSQKIATGEPSAKKLASSIRGADPKVPSPSRPAASTDLPSPGTSIGKPPEAPLRSTVMGRPAPAPLRPPEPITAAVDMLPPVSTATPTERTDATPVKAPDAPSVAALPIERERSDGMLPPPSSSASSPAQGAAALPASDGPAPAEATGSTRMAMQPETSRVPRAIPRRLLFVVGGAAAGVIVLVLMVIALLPGSKKPAATPPVVKAAVPPTPPPVVEAPKPAPPRRPRARRARGARARGGTTARDDRGGRAGASCSAATAPHARRQEGGARVRPEADLPGAAATASGDSDGRGPGDGGARARGLPQGQRQAVRR